MSASYRERTLPIRKSRRYGKVGAASKPGLVINTNLSRHNGPVPEELFPIGLDTTTTSNINDTGLRQHYAHGQYLAQTAHHDNVPITTEIRPPAGPTQSKMTIQPHQSNHTTSGRPLHRRISRLRPAPLTLRHEISPSDCAITIGLSLSPSNVPEHAAGSASTAASHRGHHYGERVQTPTIVVTPAKEDFDLGLTSEKTYTIHDNRSVSSVYSRYTNGMPMHTDSTPPMPPLPLFMRMQQIVASNQPKNDDIETPRLTSDRNISTHTMSEEGRTNHLHPSSSGRSTARSPALPTPRRSKGWWNMITSPFSAGSQAFFWRSPNPDDLDDKERMLDSAADMGHVDILSRTIDEDPVRDQRAIQSATPPTAQRAPFRMPKRSDTAPAALSSGTTRLNIYQVPTSGLAAAYYDTNRHYPSLLIEYDDVNGVRNSLGGWSPSQSVARFSKELSGRIEEDGKFSPGQEVVERAISDPKVESEGEKPGTTEDPIADFATAKDDKLRHIFTTPQTEELKGGTPVPPVTERSETQPTLASYFSPLTATPTVEEAHVATCMGPHSSHGEPREVELQSSRTPSPPALGLGVATMASRSVTEQQPLPEQGEEDTGGSRYPPQRPYAHIRNDSSGSLGLGISDGERELLPPPAARVEKPRWLDGSDFADEKQQSETRQPWARRFFWLLAASGAFGIFLLVTLLVMLVPQPHTDMAIEAEWVNLTGFPPLPSGIATIVQPSNVQNANGCVNPQSLWSCDVPSDQPADISSGSSNQPNFRLEILFRNNSSPSNETQLTRRSGFTTKASELIKRDEWANSLYAAQPALPSPEDQTFLGQYSDNVSAPYNGEETPFYVTLLDPTALTGQSEKLLKRQSNPYPYPTPSNSTNNASLSSAPTIPRPALKPNGEPAGALLYPFASAQSLRLFDRGQDTEHYGFYTYFDRTLFVANTSSLASNPAGLGSSTNVSLANATAVCIWSQTRLHVQIWTRKGSVTGLKNNLIPLNGLPAANSSANDMQAPGSFPYPVTVTLDRHGGSAKDKGVYCYALDEQKKVMQNAKIWVNEDRAFGGTIVHPAQVPSSNSSGFAVTSRSADASSITYGGIDGGNGGCACRWQNHS